MGEEETFVHNDTNKPLRVDAGRKSKKRYIVQGGWSGPARKLDVEVLCNSNDQGGLVKYNFYQSGGLIWRSVEKAQLILSQRESIVKRFGTTIGFRAKHVKPENETI